MPLFPYNRDIPDAPNDPSADQPLMKANTNNIDNIIDEDHFSFDENNGGLHRQVRLPLRGGSPGTIPPGLVAGEGTLYTKTVTSTGVLTETGLFYTPDNSTDQYQLTRTITADIAEFGTNTNYSGTLNGGWTFLPGGLVLQYGLAVSSGTSNPNTIVTLPIAMTNNVYSVTCTILTTADSRFFVSVYDVSTNQFRAVTRDSSGSKTSGITFYWQVIGK